MAGLQGEKNLSAEMYSQKRMFADRKLFVTEHASQKPSGWLASQRLELFPKEFCVGF